MIEMPDRGTHDYLRSFGLGCIFIARGHRIGAGSDLLHADNPLAAWWCNSRRSAEEVLTATGELPHSTVEGAAAAIQGAARRLGITLSEHTVVMERARAATEKLTTRLDWARRSPRSSGKTARTPI
jgi:hypothetical protein